MGGYELAPADTGELERLHADSRVREPTEELLQSVWDESAAELAQLVCAMGIDRGRAEDVLQDVYVTAWRKCPARADRLGLRRWLLRVTINRCHLQHRRRSRWQRVWRSLARVWSSTPQTADPAGDASRAEERELVRSALGRLEPTLRSILVLRYFAEFDSKEIGKILELPGSTVRSRLRTARQELARELKRSGYRHE